MIKKRVFVAVAIAFAMVAFASAQTSLSPQATAPTIDGAMQNGEYKLMQTVGSFWLGTALSADKSTLTIGIAAKSTGWISVGLGSLRMNGAYIVLGFDKAGKQTITENKGSGHSHSPSGTHKVIASVVKTVNGSTYLEFSIPAAEYLKNGKLQLILGASNTADMISFHPLFKSIEIPVAN